MPGLYDEAGSSLQARAFLHLGISVPGDSLDTKMRVAQLDHAWRERFRNLPLTVNGIPRGRAAPWKQGKVEATLHLALQDLGDIIAVEIDDAFRADYYPGIPEMKVSKKHVTILMKAMQRELDGEANSRLLTSVQLTDLPWDRQVALAERRRYWFRQFGITPRNWKKGVWSVWKIKGELPEGTHDRIKEAAATRSVAQRIHAPTPNIPVFESMEELYGYFEGTVGW